MALKTEIGMNVVNFGREVFKTILQTCQNMESDSKLSRLSIINKIETKSIAAYFTIVFIYNFEQLYAF